MLAIPGTRGKPPQRFFGGGGVLEKDQNPLILADERLFGNPLQRALDGSAQIADKKVAVATFQPDLPEMNQQNLHAPPWTDYRRRLAGGVK